MLPGQGYSQVIRNKMPPGTIISSKEESTAVTQDPLNVILLAIIVAALLSVGICSICGFIGYKVAKKRLQIKCQMCRLWIWTKHWNNGEHRGECAKRNEQFLKQLPEPFDIRCPTCLTYLKLMPKNFGMSFQCDDRDCPFRGDILNNGHNRISCFVCDYDICDSCVHRRIFILSKCIRTPQNASMSDYSSKFCNLDVDVYPVVPSISSQISSNYGGGNAGYLNESFSFSETPSSINNYDGGHCILSHPEAAIQLPLHQPPYLLSTYV